MNPTTNQTSVWRSELIAVVLSVLPLSASALVANGQVEEIGPEGAMLPAPIVAPAAKQAAADGNVTLPGDLYVEPATLHSLGFEWRIIGDANRNGKVTVRYRREGESTWRAGMDLLRIRHEVAAVIHPKNKRTVGNLHAGSILYLESGTCYEVQLELNDPDGGSARHHLRVWTKAVPTIFEGGARLHLYPEDATPIQSDGYTSFEKAYAALKPGDQLLIHAGSYTGNYRLTTKGTRDKPIVIRAASDGPVVFSGPGNLFDVSDATHHWFEGLTIRNYGVGAIHAGGDSNLEGLTVRYCRFEDHNYGILIRSRAARDIYIADNTFVGTKGTWHREHKKTEPYKGVAVAGQGIDVCYNRFENHWDGFSTFRGGGEEDDPRRMLSAIDFYCNDVRGCVDDNEADYGNHNIRVLNNRVVDVFVGLSAQPIYGGPAYFIRNVQYNLTKGWAFKLNAVPAGVMILNNTCFSGVGAEASAALASGGAWNTHIFNNLFVGVEKPALVMSFIDSQISRFDYNGLVDGNIRWVFIDEDGKPSRNGPVNESSLDRVAERLGVRYNAHGVRVSYDDFVNVSVPKGQADDGHPSDFGDYRLKPGAAAVDAGMVIPNITDGYTGAAPDLGAIELGQPLPHYGPRPRD